MGTSDPCRQSFRVPYLTRRPCWTARAWRHRVHWADVVRICGRAPSGGIIDAVVSASVHYIRSERGRCLIRGRRPRAGVNKRRKTEPETQRTGRRQSGTRQESVGQLRRDGTERRTETGSSSKDYADAQAAGVNKRAGKSVEGKNLAPLLQCRSVRAFRAADLHSILRGVNRIRNLRTCEPA
jgi:hypothetical protein